MSFHNNKKVSGDAGRRLIFPIFVEPLTLCRTLASPVLPHLALTLTLLLCLSCTLLPCSGLLCSLPSKARGESTSKATGEMLPSSLAIASLIVAFHVPSLLPCRSTNPTLAMLVLCFALPSSVLLPTRALQQSKQGHHQASSKNRKLKARHEERPTCPCNCWRRLYIN